jgi:hypothetical protein
MCIWGDEVTELSPHPMTYLNPQVSIIIQSHFVPTDSNEQNYTPTLLGFRLLLIFPERGRLQREKVLQDKTFLEDNSQSGKSVC